MGGLFVGMFTYLLALVVGVAVGVVLWTLGPWMARRTTTRPVPLAVEEETVVISAVLATPSRLAYLTELTAEDFAYPVHQRIWEVLLVSEEENLAVLKNADNNLDTLTEEVANKIDTNLKNKVRGFLTKEDLLYFDSLNTPMWAAEEKDTEVVHSAALVLDTGTERRAFKGSATLTTKENSTPGEDLYPIFRVYAPPSKKRQIFTSILGGIGGGVSVLLAYYTGFSVTPLAYILAILAAVSLVITSAIVAWVDIDTLFIDIPVWAIGTAVSWVFTIAAAFALGEPSRLLAGIAGFLGVALVFEGTNWLYKKIRGHYGQGFGDTLIIVGTVGVPAGLTGSLTVAYACVMASLVCSVVGWFVNAARGNANKGTPFPFGPWLAAGWVVGVSLWMLAGG